MAFATTGNCFNSAQGTYSVLLDGSDIDSYIAKKTTEAYRNGVNKINEGFGDIRKQVAKLQEDVNQLFEDILQVKVESPSAEQLQTTVGQHQLNELVAEDFTVEKVGNIFNVTGEIKDVDYSETFPDADTNFFVPVILTANVGAVVKYTEEVTGNEVEKTFGTDNVVARSIPQTANMALVIPITEEQRTQTISFYDDAEEAASGKGAQEFTIDASGAVLKKLGYYDAIDQDTFAAGVNGELARDGKVHINVGSEITLDKPYTFIKPTIIDGGEKNKIVTGNGFASYVADVDFTNLAIETSAAIGFIFGKDDGAINVTFDNVDLVGKPAKAHSTLNLAELIRLQTKSTVTPNVTFKNGTITTTLSADNKLTQAIAITSIDNATGGGSFTLDNSTVTANNTGNDVDLLEGVFVAAQDAEVNIENSSTINVAKGIGVYTLYDNTTTVDDSTINAHLPFMIGGRAAENTSAIVDVQNGSVVRGTNSFTTTGPKNEGAIYFQENTSNCQVTFDDTSTIICVSGPNPRNNEEYIATFAKGENNTVELNSKATINTGNGLVFTHGETDGTLYYDTTSKDDTITLNGTAANNLYVITDNATSKIINAATKLSMALRIAQAFQKGDTSKKVTITKGVEAPATDGTVMTAGVTLIER